MADEQGVVNPNAGQSVRGKSTTFIIILFAVMVITVGSLVLSLQQGDERRKFQDKEYSELMNLEPKGETAKVEESKVFAARREGIQKEVESMQKTQDSLMGVFVLGSGAIVGLLTGKLIS